MQARMTNSAMIFSDASNPTATHIRFTTRLDSGVGRQRVSGYERRSWVIFEKPNRLARLHRSGGKAR